MAAGKHLAGTISRQFNALGCSCRDLLVRNLH